MGNLTPKQELFAQTYIKTGNASEAYRTAYNVKTKSDGTINVEANKLKDHPKISLRIKELQEDLASSHNITKDRILKELANIAFIKESDFYHDDGSVKLLSELTDEQKSALSQYGVKSIRIADGVYEDVPLFKAHDKIKAIEIISKMLGFNEPAKIEHSGEIKSIDTKKLSKETMRELIESRYHKQ